MARPKKEQLLVKEYRVTIRFDETQYELLSEYARIAGIPLSDYIRKSLENNKFVYEVKFVRDSKELQEIASGLWKLGSNLNQISRYFHQHGASTPEIEAEILSGIREIYRIGTDLDKLKQR